MQTVLFSDYSKPRPPDLNPHLYLDREPDLLLLDLDLLRDRVRLLLSLPAHRGNQTPTVVHFASDKVPDDDARGPRRPSSPPGSIAAEMSDCVSLTLLMASSISLLDASAFRLALRFRPAASGFSLNRETEISISSGWNQSDLKVSGKTHFGSVINLNS